MRRRFSLRQRRQLWIESGGVCASCGQDLGQNWEADHVIPYSLGGETELSNAQALCRACNRKKGNGMSKSNKTSMRKWQAVAVKQTVDLLRSVPADWECGYLCVATPGAGKTHYASAVARDFMDRGEIDRVVVVVPTLGVRESWIETANKWGIQLNKTWAEKRDRQLPKSYDGIVVTYQGLAAAMADKQRDRSTISRWRHEAPQNAIEQYVLDGRTLIICDEIHHAGDGRDWGDGLREVGDRARHRLLLSGTPFRNDNKPMPYVRYENNRCVPDFVFDYARALGERSVRYITFPAQDGRVEFERFGDIVAIESFEEEVPEAEARTRLRMALNPTGEWLPTVLRNADARLRSLRSGSEDQVAVSDSAGIVTCIDIHHAAAVAKILESITGDAPVVVTSDDPTSLEKIERFKTGTDRWLVSVRMVSEGVDIQRARVLVYATNVISWLYFQQFAGRAVRVRTTLPGGKQPAPNQEIPDCDAVMFIPADPTLIAYAREFARLRDHVLEEELPGGPGPERDRQQPLPPTFLGSSATDQDVVLISGMRVPQRYVVEAEAMMEGKVSQHMIESLAAKLYQRDLSNGVTHPQAPANVTPDVDERPLQYRHQDARDRRTTIVKKLVRTIADQQGVVWNSDEYEDLSKKVNRMFRNRYGNRPPSALEIDELEQQTKEALEGIAEITRGAQLNMGAEVANDWLRKMGSGRHDRG